MNIKDLEWEAHPEADKIRRSAALAITRVLEWHDIYEYQKDRIIKYVLLWDLTEGAEKNYPGVKGKYLQIDKKYNLRYWSEDAIKIYEKSKKTNVSKILDMSMFWNGIN